MTHCRQNTMPCCRLWTCEEPCKCKAVAASLEVTSLRYKISCNFFSSADYYVKTEVPNWVWKLYTQLPLQFAKETVSGMTEKYLSQSFQEPSTYPKHLRLSFLALLITLVVYHQAGGDMEEFCPADTSIHCTYVFVKCHLNVSAVHQPSQQNKGKTSVPKV